MVSLTPSPLPRGEGLIFVASPSGRGRRAPARRVRECHATCFPHPCPSPRGRGVEFVPALDPGYGCFHSCIPPTLTALTEFHLLRQRGHQRWKKIDRHRCDDHKVEHRQRLPC